MGEREQLAEHLTGQGLFLAWCECITELLFFSFLHQAFLFPSLHRFSFFFYLFPFRHV